MRRPSSGDPIDTEEDDAASGAGAGAAGIAQPPTASASSRRIALSSLISLISAAFFCSEIAASRTSVGLFATTFGGVPASSDELPPPSSGVLRRLLSDFRGKEIVLERRWPPSLSGFERRRVATDSLSRAGGGCGGSAAGAAGCSTAHSDRLALRSPSISAWILSKRLSISTELGVDKRPDDGGRGLLAGCCWSSSTCTVTSSIGEEYSEHPPGDGCCMLSPRAA